MKIELNIDSGTLGPTVEEVFRQLTAEQRQTVATDVIRGFLAEPAALERQVQEQKVVDGLRARNAQLYDYHGRFDAKDAKEVRLRDSNEFREAMKGFRSTRDTMVTALTSEAVEVYRRRAKELVETDPQLQAIMAATLETIRQDFPKYVHDAMIAWFCSNMARTGEGIQAALMQSSDNSSLLEGLTNTLRNKQLV